MRHLTQIFKFCCGERPRDRDAGTQQCPRLLPSKVGIEVAAEQMLGVNEAIREIARRDGKLRFHRRKQRRLATDF